jgi:hypothetical protein
MSTPLGSNWLSISTQREEIMGHRFAPRYAGMTDARHSLGHPMPHIATQLSQNQIEELASYLSFVK